MSVVASVPHADLAAAVANSRSWRGVLRSLALPERSSRLGRLLRIRCDELNIDYTHFRGQRLWTDDDLRRAVAGCTSWLELMQSLGYPRDSGSARVTIRSHCQRLGLLLTHLVVDDVPIPDVKTDVRPENLRSAGAMIVGAMLCLEGHRVSWPLEPAPYDLLVESPRGTLSRVQVKTTTRQQRGTWICSISRSTYEQDHRGVRRRLYGTEEIDYFGIVDGDLVVYFVPSGVVGGRGSISLRRYRRFVMGRWPSVQAMRDS